MNSAVIVVGLPKFAMPSEFTNWDELTSYKCVGNHTDEDEIVYGIEIVEACESYEALNGTSVVLKIAEAGKRFRELTGKKGRIILTPHKDDL